MFHWRKDSQRGHGPVLQNVVKKKMATEGCRKKLKFLSFPCTEFLDALLEGLSHISATVFGSATA